MSEPAIISARHGRDDSTLFFLRNGRRLQLSTNQVAILAAVAERGETRSRDLHAIISAGIGPATASQRASLSRTLRRLDEQGLLFAQDRSAITCAELGLEIVERLRSRGMLTAEQRDESWQRLTGPTPRPSLLTSGGRQ